VDVGVFIRSKRRLRTWLLVPPVVLAFVGIGGMWYVRRADGDLRWRHEFLGSAPELRILLHNALSVASNSYLTARSGSEGRENLNALFNDIARQTGFTLNSLAIEESTGARKGLSAVVRGDGPLDRVLRFVEAAERPGNLVALDVAVFTSMRPTLNPPYQVVMTFFHAYSPK
jgi:hypothetical protein